MIIIIPVSYIVIVFLFFFYYWENVINTFTKHKDQVETEHFWALNHDI